jgi:hypothetical protein
VRGGICRTPEQREQIAQGVTSMGIFSRLILLCGTITALAALSVSVEMAMTRANHHRPVEWSTLFVPRLGFALTFAVLVSCLLQLIGTALCRLSNLGQCNSFHHHGYKRRP